MDPNRTQHSLHFGNHDVRSDCASDDILSQRSPRVGLVHQGLLPHQSKFSVNDHHHAQVATTCATTAENQINNRYQAYVSKLIPRPTVQVRQPHSEIVTPKGESLVTGKVAFTNESALNSTLV